MQTRPATAQDIPALGALFDGYRVFYEEPGDIELATRFIGDRLANGESTVFVAEAADGTLIGFTQLYRTFCSVAAAPIYVLYDLFVDPDHRRMGAGRELMETARQFVEGTDAVRMELATAIDNIPGQTLYESLGWRRDTEFYHYDLGTG